MNVFQSYRSLFRKGSLGWILMIILILVLTIIRFNLIGGSILSLILTICYSIVHFRIDPVYVRIEYLSYWIAGIAWCGLLVIGYRQLRHAKEHQSVVIKLFSIIAPAWTPDGATVKKTSFGMYVLLSFLAIALVCPFLAPLDPVNQGDLVTTRFLSPLHSAVAQEEIPVLAPAASSAGFIEQELRRVNNYLLERKVTYTRSDVPRLKRTEPANTYPVLFLFGTDALGRDVFSRVLYGTRISLGIGIIVAVLSMVLGMGIGFLSGMVGGKTDMVLMRAIDVLLSIPSLMLIIALFAVLGGSIGVLIVALALTGWMGVARIVRGEVLKLREQEFFIAAKLLDVSAAGMIRNHVLPNLLPTIVTASVLQLVNSIMGEAALSFLGLGIPPPTASWGNMIGESIIYLGSAWWIGVFPGIALSLFAISAQLIAEGIQE